MGGFITNDDSSKDLKQRLIKLISVAEELKFLVGFFYFSGLSELYNALKDNSKVKMKVLVGMDVDKINYRLVEVVYDDKLNNEEIVDNFFNSIKRSINSNEFDSKEFYEQSRFFIDLILQDRLIIRRTLKPNHAKLYIFKLGKEQVGAERLFITGSSNLTKAGLSTQDEFNVEISDYGFEDAKEYFDDLWKDAISITEDKEYKERLIQVLENETLIKQITPFEAYVLALKIYLDSYRGKDLSEYFTEFLNNIGFKPYRYQLDAIGQALNVLEKENGVILADVVGLGKTIMACGVAKELKRRGVVICPRGLMGDPKLDDQGWNWYLNKFGLKGLGWEVWSNGELDKLWNYIKKNEDIEVIIVDEAHKFRNEDTRGYELLKNICRGKKVILLTATPFNNRPDDILSLLNLFVIPKKSSITLEDSLKDKFSRFKSEFDNLSYIKKYYKDVDRKKRSKISKYYKNIFDKEEFNFDDPEECLRKVNQRTKYLARQIRDTIEPVTIRRNRLDLTNDPRYKDEISGFSEIEDPPREWFFELTKEQSVFYDRVLKEYFADPNEDGLFKGAIYIPFVYQKGILNNDLEYVDSLSKDDNRRFIQQKNLSDFMRRLLVKRFESSFGSFKQSIKNFRDITKKVLNFIEKTGKYILDRQLLEKIYEMELEEIEKELEKYAEKITQGVYPKNHEIYEIDKFVSKKEFIDHIKSDLNLFERILEEINELDLSGANDPKLETLIKKVKEQLEGDPDRKIVIFSEYLDTVKYLEPHLQKAFNGRILVVKSEFNKQILNDIYKNFDASCEEQSDDYDILLGTDRISEGFNLNRAGMVVNYDIPWNPVRVIQRVGRINRISKKMFEKLYIVNFFPTEKGASHIHSREIAQQKMFLIHKVLGEDSKIFDADEEPTPSGLYQKIQSAVSYEEEESFYTKIFKLFEKIKEDKPELINNLEEYPPRLKVAKLADDNELIVFIKKNRLYTLIARQEGDKVNVYETTLEDVLDRIKVSPNEKSVELSKEFWEIYDEVKKYKGLIKGRISENSLEMKAQNNLVAILDIKGNKELNKLRPFLRILLEDIRDYGTLSDYTLRRLAKLDFSNDNKIKESIEEIKQLRDELGDDYLEKSIKAMQNLNKEVIVAIENQNKKSG